MDRRTACLLFGALAIAYGCAPTAGNKLTGGARVEGEVATAAPATPARRVYVQDFALDAEATEPRTGVFGRPRNAPRPPPAKRPPPRPPL
jgi:hypothetical protein